MRLDEELSRSSTEGVGTGRRETRHESVNPRLEDEVAHLASEALEKIRKKGGQPGNTNAVKHALTGRFFLVEGEDPAEFEALRAELL